MPTELELCTVAAVIGALLGGGVTYAVTHKIDGAKLAHEKAAHADDIARINAISAQQLADALARGQAAEGHVATLEQKYNEEVANHAKDNLSYRAQLLAGTQRVRVHVATCSSSGAGSKSAAPASQSDDAAPYADLSPTVAAGVFTVVDDADDVASRLKALQAYVTKMQDDGYISK